MTTATLTVPSPGRGRPLALADKNRRAFRLRAFEVRALCAVIDALNACPTGSSPFDEGWFAGWMGYVPRHAYPDGSGEEGEWAAGYRLGRRDRKNDDAGPNYS